MLVRLILLGPPGAGKGTQAARLAADLAVAYIATGDMFRALLRSDTPLAERLRGYIQAGELVPDDFTNELLEKRLAEPDASEGFVLDGYPRNVEQALRLDQLLSARGVALDLAVKFMVTGPEIVARLSGRWVCPTCGTVYHLVTKPPKQAGICDLDATPLVQREDDKEETVLHRLAVYGESTKPLYDLYASRGILREIDAIGSTEEVYQRLTAAVGAEAKP
jgi:adenylate kinase